MLLSVEHARDLAGRIDRGAAARPAATTSPVGGGTVYLAVVDGAGSAVSLIESNYKGFGSGVLDPATGIGYHNRGSYFSLHEGHPNELTPARRGLFAWRRRPEGGVVVHFRSRVLTKKGLGSDSSSPFGSGQLIEGGIMPVSIVDAYEADYVALTPAKDTDIVIPFVEIMWQRASWPCSALRTPGSGRAAAMPVAHCGGPPSA